MKYVIKICREVDPRRYTNWSYVISPIKETGYLSKATIFDNKEQADYFNDRYHGHRCEYLSIVSEVTEKDLFLARLQGK